MSKEQKHKTVFIVNIEKSGAQKVLNLLLICGFLNFQINDLTMQPVPTLPNNNCRSTQKTQQKRVWKRNIKNV